MKQETASRTLRVFARLLSYPDQQLRAHLDELSAALQSEQALPAARLAELEALIGTLKHSDALKLEEQYVDIFDHGRSTSLHLFEHVHGDSRERGPAMIDLTQTYEKAGLFLGPDEMPDYLPVVLEFVSTQPAAEARAFLAEMAHIFNAIFNALQKRNSAYAAVLGGLLELAGEKAHPVKIVADEAIDKAWEEPEVFGGCSSEGQNKPGQPQPVQFVKKETLRANANANTTSAAHQGASL